MESLENNLYCKILSLRLEIMKNNERERLSIRKYGYVKEAKKFKCIVKDLNKELDAIEHKLKVDFESLELTSDNLEKIASISRVFL